MVWMMGPVVKTQARCRTASPATSSALCLQCEEHKDMVVHWKAWYVTSNATAGSSLLLRSPCERHSK